VADGDGFVSGFAPKECAHGSVSGEEGVLPFCRGRDAGDAVGWKIILGSATKDLDSSQE